MIQHDYITINGTVYVRSYSDRGRMIKRGDDVMEDIVEQNPREYEETEEYIPGWQPSGDEYAEAFRVLSGTENQDPITTAITIRGQVEVLAETMDDATALDWTELFRHWEYGILYDVGDRVQYEGILYKCIQSHVSQPDWTPDLVPALFVRVSIEEWPEWVQPTGAQDAYMTGDKVTYEGKHYVSLIDNNTWSPADYPAGWEVQE